MSTYLKEKNIELQVDTDKDTVKIIVEGEESKYSLSLKSQSLKQNLIRNLMIILDTNDRDFVKGIVDKEYRWLIRHKEESNLMITGQETPPSQEIYNAINMDLLTKSLKKSFKNEFKILKELIINNNQDPPSKNNNDTELITDLREEIYYLDKELRYRLNTESENVIKGINLFREKNPPKDIQNKEYCLQIDTLQKENQDLKEEIDDWKEAYEDIDKQLKENNYTPKDDLKSLKELREELEKQHKEEMDDLKAKFKKAYKTIDKENKKLFDDEVKGVEEELQVALKEIKRLNEVVESISTD